MFVSPGSSFTYGAAVTPSDTVNNILHAHFLQNIGTSGVFTVRQAITAGTADGVAPTAATTVVVYLSQGQTIECGSSWTGVNATSLGSGVSLYAYW